MKTVTALASYVGRQAACEMLDMPRTSFYRVQSPLAPSAAGTAAAHEAKAPPPRALDAVEKEQVIQVLNSERFSHRDPVGTGSSSAG